MQKAPHFLLLADANSDSDETRTGGTWQFVLEELGGADRIEVEEYEPNVFGDRLQLLAIVRGLEALEQPSKVTLVTPCKYIGRGIRHYLKSWRENGYQWERFGEMTTVKNSDLWVRIDRAMQYHSIECRIWSLDRGHLRSLPPKPVSPINSVRSDEQSSIVFQPRQNGPYRSSPYRSHLNRRATKRNWIRASRTRIAKVQA